VEDGPDVESRRSQLSFSDRVVPAVARAQRHLRAARGEGLAYRVACEILPRYFVPPPMPLRMPDEHYNVRRMQRR
jgi:hypothetical protein